MNPETKAALQALAKEFPVQKQLGMFSGKIIAVIGKRN